MFEMILSKVLAIRDRFLYGNLVTNLSDIERARDDIFSGQKPFLISRFGNVEFSAFREIYDSRRDLGLIERLSLSVFGRLAGIREKTKIRLRLNAGVFSASSNADFVHFFEEYYKCVSEIDFFFRWFSGDALLLKAGLRASIAPLEYLNILQSPKFFEGVFESKKLLIVSPHVNTIKYQFENSYPQLCEHLGVDDFSVATIQTFHKIHGGDGDWFVELERLKQEILGAREGVDFIILGCGAYGLPLAAFAKSIGISAIHLGGATQLLFGIIGERWIDLIDDTGISNFWIRPLDSDRPKGFELIEGGCYW